MVFNVTKAVKKQHNGKTSKEADRQKKKIKSGPYAPDKT